MTGVIGGESSDGVVGLGKSSLARYGDGRAPKDGEDGGDELGCRYGDEEKYDEAEDDEVNISGEPNAGDDGICFVNRW